MYLRIEQAIQERISSGEWSPGQLIPPEVQLCELFGVSRITIRHALSRLVDRGLLIRERGRGTFVREPGLTASARGVTSFTAEVRDLGMQPSSRVLEIGLVAPPRAVALALDLPPNAQAIRIHRIRLGDGRPIGLQTAYLVADRFPGLVELDLNGLSLYAVLAERYGVSSTEAVETFTVGGVTREDAPLLEVEPGAHAMYVERTTYDSRGPFEHVYSVMRGDRYRIRLALRNL